MQTYANALLIAIPFFSILILLEVFYDYWKNGALTMYKSFDTISSLSSGITNLIKDSLGLIVVILSYPFALKYLAITNIEATWLVYIAAFVCMDFASYWNHRLAHSINIFWNRHAIHHSSEEFNLPCALRQSVSEFFKLSTFFLIPAAILGVPHEIIVVIAPLHLFMQFWYHTRFIPKLGFLEYILVTPSQHRVHHAINPEYLDKNMSAIFCVWDRLFGTFQEELADVPPVYGITRPAQTWNPFKINFQHLTLLFKDAWHTKNWWHKLTIWFKPLGWRPPDVEKAFPVDYIKEAYNFEKYDSNPSAALNAWAWFQFVINNILLAFLLFNFAEIGTMIPLYAFFIVLNIYGFTTLMDKDLVAIPIEITRSVLACTFIIYSGGWFGIEQSFAYFDLFVFAYYSLTILGTVYFYFELKSEGKVVEMA